MNIFSTLKSFVPTLTALVFVASFDLKFDIVGITFFLVVLQSSTFVGLTAVRKVNLLSVFYVFNLIFLGVLPWLHYSSGVVFWRSGPIPEDVHFYTNLLILMAGFLVFIPHLLVRKKRPKIQTEASVVRNVPIKMLLLLILSTFAFIGVLKINDYSFVNLLVRGLLDEITGGKPVSSALALMLSMVYRLTPVFCFFYASAMIPRHWIFKFTLFFLLLLSVFPTGVARYMAAFTYIPVMLLYFPIFRNAMFFANSLILGIFFVFPFLNQFRYFQGFGSLRFLPNREFFFAAHFDAYENFASAIDLGFVTYGKQLLGVLLFFVPRSIWGSKPVGSGYQLADTMNYSLKNISMPFLGEGYVNFGFVGVVLFSILLGYLIAKIDSHFIYALNDSSGKSFTQAVYFFLIGALFFVLRGDLLSGYAFVSAGLGIAFGVSFLMKLTGENRGKN